ncbi:hypothetical protein [Methanimicrococcus hongohii]|uniref:hypothetical protein n=1 Tax=Methanimicrococcus hongohii TaxID=3028295 RepID=UPI00292FCC8A|nr:hypothetical protein [Methanimicrococcus sp. Hf6]
MDFSLIFFKNKHRFYFKLKENRTPFFFQRIPFILGFKGRSGSTIFRDWMFRFVRKLNEKTMFRPSIDEFPKCSGGKEEIEILPVRR